MYRYLSPSCSRGGGSGAPYLPSIGSEETLTLEIRLVIHPERGLSLGEKDIVTIEDLRILVPGFGLSTENMYYN